MLKEIVIAGVHISTYFVVISFTCVLCSFWFLKRAEANRMNRLTAIDLTIVCLIAGFIGARLLHVFYEDPEYYRANPLATLYVWNGGFVFLGGALGAILGGAGYCLVRSEPFWFWADVAIPAGSLGYALGRLGCFLNGCCYGKFCQLPWAIYIEGGSRHPTQAYASAWELMVVGILLWIEPRNRMAGNLFGIWMVLHAIGRVMMEYFRDDPRGILISGQSIGTWMSLGLGLFGLAIVILRPGHRRLI